MAHSNLSPKWLEEGVLRLPEVVNVATVPVILKWVEASSKFISVVDFSKVEQADSVALALILSFQMEASQSIEVRHLPEELTTLVHLYDLDQVFQLS